MNNEDQGVAALQAADAATRHRLGREMLAWLRAEIESDRAPWRLVLAGARRNGKATARAALVQLESHDAILDLHSPMVALPGSAYFNDAHLTKEPMTLCRSCEPEYQFRRTESWPCRTLYAVGRGFRHRVGFKSEWLPWPGAQPPSDEASQREETS